MLQLRMMMMMMLRADPLPGLHYARRLVPQPLPPPMQLLRSHRSRGTSWTDRRRTATACRPPRRTPAQVQAHEARAQAQAEGWRQCCCGRGKGRGLRQSAVAAPHADEPSGTPSRRAWAGGGTSRPCGRGSRRLQVAAGGRMRAADRHHRRGWERPADSVRCACAAATPGTCAIGTAWLTIDADVFVHRGGGGGLDDRGGRGGHVACGVTERGGASKRFDGDGGVREGAASKHRL